MFGLGHLQLFRWRLHERHNEAHFKFRVAHERKPLDLAHGSKLLFPSLGKSGSWILPGQLLALGVAPKRRPHDRLWVLEQRLFVNSCVKPVGLKMTRRPRSDVRIFIGVDEIQELWRHSALLPYGVHAGIPCAHKGWLLTCTLQYTFGWRIRRDSSTALDLSRPAPY